MCTCLCAHFYTSRFVWVKSLVLWHKSVSIWAWASAYTLWLVSLCLGLSQSHTLSRCSIHSKDATSCATVILGREKQTSQTKKTTGQRSLSGVRIAAHTHTVLYNESSVCGLICHLASQLPFLPEQKKTHFNRCKKSFYCLATKLATKNVQVLVIICNHLLPAPNILVIIISKETHSEYYINKKHIHLHLLFFQVMCVLNA